MTERVNILGVKIDAVTMAQAVERVANLIDAGKPSNSTKSVTVK